ncbi:MAG TPA: amidohydrolase family protein [Vicinamibacterales bacterium]|nr:amidohydrolase family protein [Vicinamibacterales bacterium]
MASAHGEAGSIRFARRVLEIGEPPRDGDQVVDLEGAWVLPGLINAHDHLELNHYGSQHAGAPYRNVQQWVDDMRTRLRDDPVIVNGRAQSLAARVWLGGFKNLLAGVTLVAHHNPVYPGLRRVTPVRVVHRFGWAHSFAMQRQPVGARGELGGDVRDRFRRTPRSAPFVLHLAEGVDAEAGDELPLLDQAGALSDNTVLVHGVAISREGWRLVQERGASAVWCPASNLALFGTTMEIRHALHALPGRVALGTDSRLSGSRDLLDELQVASREGLLTPAERLALVTSAPAEVLRCAPAGRLTRGGLADLIVIPAHHGSAGEALSGCRRHHLQLVVMDGRPRLGLPEWAHVFRARGVVSGAMRLDGFERIVDAKVLRAAAQFGLREPGVELCH